MASFKLLCIYTFWSVALLVPSLFAITEDLSTEKPPFGSVIPLSHVNPTPHNSPSLRESSEDSSNPLGKGAPLQDGFSSSARFPRASDPLPILNVSNYAIMAYRSSSPSKNPQKKSLHPYLPLPDSSTRYESLLSQNKDKEEDELQFYLELNTDPVVIPSCKKKSSPSQDSLINREDKGKSSLKTKK